MTLVALIHVDLTQNFLFHARRMTSQVGQKSLTETNRYTGLKSIQYVCKISLSFRFRISLSDMTNYKSAYF